MIQRLRLNRGIIDKSSPAIKIPVNLKADYQTLLSTCIRKLWDDNMETDSSFAFYLNDMDTESTMIRDSAETSGGTSATAVTNEPSTSEDPVLSDLENGHITKKLSSRLLDDMYCIMVQRKTWYTQKMETDFWVCTSS